MSKPSKNTSSKFLRQLVSITCAILLGARPGVSFSGVFENSDVLPFVQGIGFDRDSVGFVANIRDESLLPQLSKVFFVYERSSHSMRELDARKFHERFPSRTLSFYPMTTEGYREGVASNGMKYKLKLKYCGEGTTDDIREVILDNSAMDVNTQRECASVSSLEVVNQQIWLGTAYSGEVGFSKAEGIIVQDMTTSQVISRINGLSGWVVKLHLDPYSKNIWAITENGIYEIGPHFNILTINLFRHDFDPLTGEPHFLFSSSTTPGNPFAVISRLLPKEDRKDFYATVEKIPTIDLNKFNLYDFFMCCDFNSPKYPKSFASLTPFFIRASLQNDKLLVNNWRQSICRIGGPDTKQYCQRSQ